MAGNPYQLPSTMQSTMNPYDAVIAHQLRQQQQMALQAGWLHQQQQLMAQLASQQAQIHPFLPQPFMTMPSIPQMPFQDIAAFPNMVAHQSQQPTQSTSLSALQMQPSLIMANGQPMERQASPSYKLENSTSSDVKLEPNISQAGKSREQRRREKERLKCRERRARKREAWAELLGRNQTLANSIAKHQRDKDELQREITGLQEKVIAMQTELQQHVADKANRPDVATEAHRADQTYQADEIDPKRAHMQSDNDSMLHSRDGLALLQHAATQQERLKEQTDRSETASEVSSTETSSPTRPVEEA
eukprot:TRINITY_DN9764_c0_g4_i1.p1 TRINITY_DN9764_c0_g4~~TRINITY_DN9764_c0_g4_i1.p1  ORF type:complete len:304 (+),score=83.78 TRINITY_DN9764_c0_g4_i1:442-1353(+)